MKISNVLLPLFLVFFIFNTKAQIVNLNPDPNGDPWIAGGIPEVTPEIQEKIDAIPALILSPISSTTELPEVVDNSQNIFMRPIFSQYQGCCAQASGVGYVFTYEINRLRNLQANEDDNEENWYPTHYTWNFLNHGIGTGSWYFDGWDIIKENGCPNFTTWGGMAGDKKRWMTGYDNYQSGMSNKVDSYWHINLSSPAGLDVFKHWINDHNEGSTTGGLGSFSIYMGGISEGLLPPGTEEEGESVIADWSYSIVGSHAMTFVGYNDNIKYDIDGDGLFTNDQDTNGDGVVDMRDWEIGALKVANSWGESYPFNNQDSDGTIYMPYRLLAKPGAVMSHLVYVINAVEETEVEFAVKTRVDYSCREKIEFRVGYANNANQSTVVDYTNYSSFDYFQGGCFPMQGINIDPIEVGLDFGHWYINEDFGKIFFVITENEMGLPSEGVIEQFSMVDYRWNETFELSCNETNVAIVDDGVTKISIDYDLIPHEADITENLSLFSNMVSRFTPTVTTNSILTLEDGVHIDMYNSEIHINEGSSFVIEDNATISAKRGNCKIIIDGDISVGSNVNFISDEGAELEIILNNNSIVATFDNSTFERVRFHNYSQNLTISNSTFMRYYRFMSHRGNISFLDTDFISGTDQSWLSIQNDEENDNTATVSNCDFLTENSLAAIDVFNYEKFFINNNTIEGYTVGIQLWQAGDGNTGSQQVNNNEVFNCSYIGILAYNSVASIFENYVHNNLFGVRFINNSNIAFFGNPLATSYSDMNYITNNEQYELYFSEFSFPWYFRYNAIIDENNAGNPDDPLLYYSNTSGKIDEIDIRYNCWGNNFVASEDLYPSEVFIYDPTWCPGGSPRELEVAEQLFIDGKSQFESQQYVDAQTTFKTLINQFPSTIYAETAMKELITLEKFVDNDYNSLKEFFQTNDSIIIDTTLTKLATRLVNNCDIKLANYQDAISYFENIILNPASLEDSIFAIIDLGYVYFLMENDDNKSSYLGKLAEFKPVSKKQFYGQRDFLLSLIPDNKNNKPSIGNINNLQSGELLQNVPNPFNESTRIFYKLKTDSKVQLSIYNYTGQLIETFNVGQVQEGIHHIDFNASDLKSGIYLYSLSINGQITDSKKMTIMK